jgi:hypothetical protein
VPARQASVVGVGVGAAAGAAGGEGADDVHAVDSARPVDLDQCADRRACIAYGAWVRRLWPFYFSVTAAHSQR